MLFSATYACPACRLRFARRARCPECDGTRVLSLATEKDRAELERLARKPPAAGGSWLDVILRALLALRASLMRALGGGRLLPPPPPFEPRALRVYAPPARASAAGTATSTETLSGVVRRASVSMHSPVAGAECVVFGVHGEVDGAPVDDAEGGDFDLELESGGRVLVSLEHAVLLEEEPATPAVVALTPSLEELLESRGIGVAIGGERAEAVGTLAEVLVREGDHVTVEAEVSGGPALSFGQRAPSRVRVATGDESSPLIVRVSPRGRRRTS